MPTEYDKINDQEDNKKNAKLVFHPAKTESPPL
jgi:hypothetical protein